MSAGSFVSGSAVVALAVVDGDGASTGVIGGGIGAAVSEGFGGVGLESEGIFFDRTRFTARGGGGAGGAVMVFGLEGIGHTARLRTTRLSGVVGGGGGVTIQLSSNSIPTASRLPAGAATPNRLRSRCARTTRLCRCHGDLFDPRPFASIDDAD